MRTHLRRRRVKLKIDLRCAYASKFRETPSGCVYAAYLWYIALQLSNSETSWNLFWNFLKLSFCRSCRFHRGLGRWSCFEFEPSEDGEIKMNFWIDDPLRENQCLPKLGSWNRPKLFAENLLVHVFDSLSVRSVFTNPKLALWKLNDSRVMLAAPDCEKRPKHLE
jgi:hypothetical protein